MSKNNNLSRRELIARSTALGLMSSPLAVLFDSLLTGLVRKAAAAGMGLTPRRYVSIQMFGAPPRWMYDLFLNPYGNANNFDPKNSSISTRYSAAGGRYTNQYYSTVKLKGINAPHMWQFTVPKAGGGVRPMSDLLDNLLVLQGLDTANPGHDGAAALHFRPLGAGVTQPAMVADVSKALIPAINAEAPNYRFLSAANKTPVLLALAGNNGNMLKSLLSPFIGGNGVKINEQKAAVQGLIDNAMGALDAQAQGRHPAGEALNSARKSAEDMFRFAAGDLDGVWNEKRSRYEALIAQSLQMYGDLPGIGDKAIGVTANRGAIYNISSLGGGAVIPSHADLRSLIKTTTRIRRMAEHFAVVEYVLKNDLSHSIVISPQALTGIDFENPNPPFDEHGTGRMPSLYLNTMYYQAFSACLLELIDQIKGPIFDETVIEVFSEFNRAPRSDGSGSDHGYQGKSVAYYSGAIQGPLVVGNILQDAGGIRPGCWGKGAATLTKTGQSLGLLNLGHQASTLAKLLRVPSPVTASPSLISSGDKVTEDDLYAEKTRVV